MQGILKLDWVKLNILCIKDIALNENSEKRIGLKLDNIKIMQDIQVLAPRSLKLMAHYLVLYTQYSFSHTTATGTNDKV